MNGDSVTAEEEVPPITVSASQDNSDATLDSFLASTEKPASDDQLDGFVHDTAPEIARKKLDEYKAGKLPLDDEHVIALSKIAQDGVGAWESLGHGIKYIFGHPIENMKGIGGAIVSGAKTVHAAGEEIARPYGQLAVDLQAGHHPIDALWNFGVNVFKNLSTESQAAARGVTGLAPALGGAAAEVGELVTEPFVDKEKAQELNARMNLGAYSAENLKNRAFNRIAEITGTDPNSSLYQVAENVAPLAVPVGGGEAAAGKIAQAADKAVDVGMRVAGKTIQAGAKTVKAVTPVAAAAGLSMAGHPYAAVIELGGMYGMAGVRKRIIDAPLNVVADFGKTMSKVPDGETIIGTARQAVDDELSRLNQQLNDLKDKHVGKVDDAFKMTNDGQPLYTAEELKGPAKEVRQVQDRLDDLNVRRDTLKSYEDVNRALSAAARTGIKVGLDTAAAGAIGAGFAGSTESPREYEQARQGFEAGAAIGLAARAPRIPLMIRGEVRNFNRGDLIQAGKTNLSPDDPNFASHQEAMSAMPVEAQDYVHTYSGLAKANGGKVVVLTPDKFTQSLGGKAEDVGNVPNGYYDSETKTAYINSDALTHGPVSHEVSHALEEAGGLLEENHPVNQALDQMILNPKYHQAIQEAAALYKAKIHEIDPSFELTPEYVKSEIVADLASDIIQKETPQGLYGGRSFAQRAGALFKKFLGSQATQTSVFGWPVTPELRDAVADSLFQAGEKASQRQPQAQTPPPHAPPASVEEFQAHREAIAPNEPTGAPSKIVGPALITPQGVEKGMVGETHADLMNKAVSKGNESAIDALGDEANHVFHDTNGELHDREAAAKIAVAANQVPHDVTSLQGEHLIQNERPIPVEHGEFKQEGYTAEAPKSVAEFAASHSPFADALTKEEITELHRQMDAGKITDQDSLNRYLEQRMEGQRGEALRAIKTVQDSGKPFEATFVKTDGSLRTGQFQFGVREGLKGGKKSTSANPDLYTVYDLDAKGYRTFDINRLQRIQGEGVDYRYSKKYMPGEQEEISSRVKKQKENDESLRRESLWQRLMSAPRDKVTGIAEDISPEDSQWIIQRLDAAPGDNPTVRAALSKKFMPREEPKGKTIVLYRRGRFGKLTEGFHPDRVDERKIVQQFQKEAGTPIGQIGMPIREEDLTKLSEAAAKHGYSIETREPPSFMPADRREPKESQAKEKLVSPAIRVNDLQFTGVTIEEAKAKAKAFGLSPEEIKNGEQGFVTNKGVWKTPDQAGEFTSERRQMGKQQSEGPLSVQAFNRWRRYQPSDGKKTRLDMILDEVEKSGEVTIRIEGPKPSREMVKKVQDAAEARGMTAGYDGGNYLIRKNPAISEEQQQWRVNVNTDDKKNVVKIVTATSEKQALVEAGKLPDVRFVHKDTARQFMPSDEKPELVNLGNGLTPEENKRYLEIKANPEPTTQEADEFSALIDKINAHTEGEGSSRYRDSEGLRKFMPSQPQDHIDFNRVKELGFTDKLNEGGYLTPEGKMIDLSGKKEGGQPNVRSLDHREVGGQNAMLEFMNLGNIRMDGKLGSLNIMRKPTPAQEKALTRMIEERNGEVVLEVEDGLGDWIPSGDYSGYAPSNRSSNLVYDEGTKAKKIIGDIRRFYSGENIESGKRFMPSTQPFYSQLERTIESQPDNASPEQLRAAILKGPGVKQAELRETKDQLGTSFDQWLKDNPKASKNDMLDFVRENQVQVKEVEKGESGSERAYGGMDLGDFDFKEDEDTGNIEVTDPNGEFFGEYGNETQAKKHVQDTIDLHNEESSDTKFSQYQLPGSIPGSYRETLATLPQKTSQAPVVEKGPMGQWQVTYPDGNFEGGYATEEEARRAAIAFNRSSEHGIEAPLFHSSHWDEPNVVLHIRSNERETPNGKMLFLEELQSDWAQKGRREGFGKQKTHPVGWASTEDTTGMTGVPDLPFKSNWKTLGLKIALRKAAETGASELGWTTGDIQNERYDLSKQVRGIEWYWNDKKAGTKIVRITPNEGNVIELGINKDGIAGGVEGGRSGYGEFDGKHIADVIGKDIGKQIVDESHGELSGEGLKIGGSGQKGFYDKELVNLANDLVKKWGVKVRDIPLDTPETKNRYKADGDVVIDIQTNKVVDRGDSYPEATDLAEQWNQENRAEAQPAKSNIVHSIPITDSMRRDILEKGQPLFQPQSNVQPQAQSKTKSIPPISQPDQDKKKQSKTVKTFAEL